MKKAGEGLPNILMFQVASCSSFMAMLVLCSRDPCENRESAVFTEGKVEIPIEKVVFHHGRGE